MEDIVLNRVSPFSGKSVTRTLNVDIKKLRQWERKDLLLQEAFPHLSADDREWIKTGILPEEWDEMFG